MEMKFRTTSGAIISRDPLADAPALLGLADPATERGVGQVEPAHLLRKQIERVIREYSADPAKAALAVCVILEGNLGLAEDGYFDGDETVLKALMAADQADD
ncbi:Uncharacterized protein ALO52_00148 [Pseudomonas syringae pv. primulae]|uniref:Uncharacterized protein n=1 Tax=Pseudomonas syringae pv. primulae TaxID=251707 RepID=A0A0Q0DIZ7_9PSED|nr:MULTISPECIES: hypothetical protein [Pseudomonas syringae group]KPY39334.1 Uncharacterized protein ALO52_00148 [Pseudomonas syringae pv. primulae]MBD8184789.1 hypothetical protein [Pseudomonas viridiflava]